MSWYGFAVRSAGKIAFGVMAGESAVHRIALLLYAALTQTSYKE
jgi:hypothetical protein